MKRLLDEGTYRSAGDLADAERVTRSFVNRLMRLILLAPDIQEAIIDRRQLKGMQLEELTRPLPSVTARRDNINYLHRLRERLEWQIAIEFCGDGWMTDNFRARTLSLLEKLGMAYVVVDEPQGFRSSTPPVVAATSPLALVRFHGHNAENVKQHRSGTPAWLGPNRYIIAIFSCEVGVPIGADLDPPLLEGFYRKFKALAPARQGCRFDAFSHAVGLFRTSGD